jgi:hypothetical protein
MLIGQSVLLVERPDNAAGTRSYALRTVRRELTRMAGYLSADVITTGQALRADADMWFRFGRNSVKVENNFIHAEGSEDLVGRILVHSRKKQEPRYIKLSPSRLVDTMTDRFESTVLGWLIGRRARAGR